MKKFFGNFILPVYGWLGILLSALGISYIGLYEFEVVELGLLKNTIDVIFSKEEYMIISLVILVIIFLISVRLTFGMFKDKKDREPIMVNGEHGKVAITLDTFENIVNLVLNEITNIKEYNVLAKKEGNDSVEILVKLNLTSSLNIKELINEVQAKSIEEIQKATDVKVKNMHFKIENIESLEKENTEKKAKKTKKTLENGLDHSVEKEQQETENV